MFPSACTKPASPNLSSGWSYEPREAGGLVGAAILRRDEHGDYLLFYQFENFGLDSCTITIWLDEKAPEAESHAR